MIRRLHLEPPKLALPLDKSQECDNPATEESIAAEFRKLLAKARSGLPGGRDEVAALGLALSQAASAVKTQHVELKKTDDSVGEDLSEVTLDHSEEIDDGRRGGGDKNLWVMAERSTTKEPNTGIAREDTDEAIELPGEVSDEQDVEIDNSGGEISLDEEIACAVMPEFADHTEGVSDGEELSRDLLGGEVKTEGTLKEDQRVLGDSAEKGSGLTRVTLTQVSDEESVELQDGDIEGEYNIPQITQDNGALPSRLQAGRGANQAQVNEQASARDPEIERFLAQEGVSADESWGGMRSDGSLRSSVAGGDERGGNDYARGGGATKSEGSLWGASSPLEGLAKSQDQNKDISLQLTMLRQAYEGLKAQTLGQSEPRARLVTGTVSGVGASSEAKHAQSEVAPRGARYLNKATAQRMMERIESALKEAARSRDGKTISLKLEPLQLGRVKCDVSLRDGALHARITPQNREVVQAVREHSHELQVALRRLGLNVERVTVQVHGERETPSPFGADHGLSDGKSFQGDGNNMPGRQGQHPEKTIGNDLADVTRATPMEAGITPADHWIA